VVLDTMFIVILHLRAVSLLWHMMLDPQWVSFWTACQALLLFLNLFAVGWYVVETIRLRRVAQQQVEAQIRPALEVVVNVAAAGIYFKNLGTGPALDLRVSSIPSNGKVNWHADDNGSGLGHSFVEAGQRSMGGISSREFGPERSLQVVYESLSGRTYATSVTFPEPGIAGKTRFFMK